MSSTPREQLAQKGLQTLLWSDMHTEVAAYWPAGPKRQWFFWRAPSAAYACENRWHVVSTQGGRYYSSHDTLAAAFANAQRVEAALGEQS